MADTDVTLDIPHTNGDTGGGEPASSAVEDIHVIGNGRDSGQERGEQDLVKPASPTVEKRPFVDEIITPEASGVVESPPQEMNGSAESGMDVEDISSGNGAVSSPAAAEQVGLESNQTGTGMEADGATVEADVGAEQHVVNDEEIPMTVESQAHSEPPAVSSEQNTCAEPDLKESLDKESKQDEAVAEAQLPSEPNVLNLDTKTEAHVDVEISEQAIAPTIEDKAQSEPIGMDLADVAGCPDPVEPVLSADDLEETQVAPSKDEPQLFTENEETEVAPLNVEEPVQSAVEQDIESAPPVLEKQTELEQPIVADEESDVQVAPPVLEKQTEQQESITADTQEVTETAPSALLEDEEPIMASKEDETQVAPPADIPVDLEQPIAPVEQSDVQVAPPGLTDEAKDSQGSEPIVPTEQEDTQVAPQVLKSEADSQLEASEPNVKELSQEEIHAKPPTKDNELDLQTEPEDVPSGEQKDSPIASIEQFGEETSRQILEMGINAEKELQSTKVSSSSGLADTVEDKAPEAPEILQEEAPVAVKEDLVEAVQEQAVESTNAEAQEAAMPVKEEAPEAAMPVKEEAPVTVKEEALVAVKEEVVEAVQEPTVESTNAEAPEAAVPVKEEAPVAVKEEVVEAVQEQAVESTNAEAPEAAVPAKEEVPVAPKEATEPVKVEVPAPVPVSVTPAEVVEDEAPEAVKEEVPKEKETPEEKESDETESQQQAEMDVLGNGLLIKKILSPGQGHETRPVNGDVVTLTMRGKLDDGTAVDCHGDYKFTLGDGDVIQAFDLAVALMEKGERCELTTDNKYAYGILGDDSQEPHIPPNAKITYDIHLTNVEDPLDVSKLSATERTELGDKKRERGNYYYGREEYTSAINLYTKALHILDDSNQSHSEEASDLQQLLDTRVKCYNNLALAQYKVEAYEAALKSCDKVLRAQPENVKALFRKGKCLADKGDVDNAIIAFKKALALEPQRKNIHQELSRLLSKKKAEDDQQKEMYKRMIGADKEEPAPPPEKKETNWVSLILLALLVALLSAIYRVVTPAE